MDASGCAIVEESLVHLVDLLIDPHQHQAKLSVMCAEPQVLAMVLGLLTEIAGGTVATMASSTDASYIDALALLIKMLRAVVADHDCSH